MTHSASLAFASFTTDPASPHSLQSPTPAAFRFVQPDLPLKPAPAPSPSTTILRLIRNWRIKGPLLPRNHSSKVARVAATPVNLDMNANMAGQSTQPYANDAFKSGPASVDTSGSCCNRSVLVELEPLLASTLVGNCSSVGGALNGEDKKLELRTRMHTASQWAAGKQSAELPQCFPERQEDFERALNAASLLASLASSDTPLLSTIASLPCIVEELVQLLKDGRSKAASDCILDVLCAFSSLEEGALRCINSGAVAITADILTTETRREVSEKALILLGLLNSRKEGRIAAQRHAATIISVTGKKLLRVSEAATESAVRILWTMFRYSSDDHETLKQRALEVGIVGKLVVLLQVGCDDATRIRAGKLLRVLAEQSA